MKGFKFDKCWKYLIYFDFILPLLLFVLAWLLKIPQLSKLFHSYLIYIINPIPHPGSLTGIIGLVMHIGVIGYLLFKKKYRDAALCSIIALLAAVFFFFELNYIIIKPLEFSNL